MPAQPRNKYAVGPGWSADLEDVTTPSGQTCQVRRPGVRNLIKSGVLNNGDALLGIVENKHVRKARGDKPVAQDVDMQAILANPEKLEQLLDSIDSVVMHIVVQPTIMPVPLDDGGNEIPFDSRDHSSGVGYVDVIPLEDKMFLFNYAVGGSSDLQRFRRKFDGNVADLVDGEVLPRPPKSTSRSRTPR